MVAPASLHVVALAGLSPAVVTATMWALLKNGAAVGRITIITTPAGARGVAERLLGSDGALSRLFGPLAVPPVHLETVGCSTHGDIRSRNDHVAMTSLIDSVIERATRPYSLPVHASIAGGRKTMASSLTLSMALHARPGDSLSHVLTALPWAEDPDFLFPTTAEQECAVTLIELPMPRLRPLIAGAKRRPSCLLHLLGDVQGTIDALSPLVLDLPERRLSSADGSASAGLGLPPLQAALLAWIALLAPDPLLAGNIAPNVFVGLYRRAGAPPATRQAALRAMRDPIGVGLWLREHVSRLRRRLALRPDLSITILSVGARPGIGYRLSRAVVVKEESIES